MDTLGKRIKLLRTEKNVMAKTIAEYLNITYRTYQKYETNEIDPPTSKTLALADYFDVSLDYLVGRSDEPNSHKERSQS